MSEGRVEIFDSYQKGNLYVFYTYLPVIHWWASGEQRRMLSFWLGWDAVEKKDE
jgi:hypothetical protein